MPSSKKVVSSAYPHNDKTENFLWDGLALIHRGDNSFVNEPYVTGGNPILSSKDGVMFNDMLGTTLGVKSGEQVNQVNMTAFGEPLRLAANGDSAKNQDAFHRKPHIGELGYAFLFRNYRPEQGKWQTADPLGYPDGWNNLAYVNNGVTSAIDWLGGETITQVVSCGTWSTWSAWYEIGLPNPITGIQMWQRSRMRTNVLQDYSIDISYNTDNTGLMWANLGVGVTASVIAAIVAGPPGWIILGAVTINQVIYQLYLPPGSPTHYDNWTPLGGSYNKLEVENETYSGFTKPE